MGFENVDPFEREGEMFQKSKLIEADNVRDNWGK